MNRFIISILLTVFTCTLAAAETSVWKAQKGSSIIYLGGTCHLLRQSDYPLPPEFARAYSASDIVVFETDIGRLTDPATQQKLLAKAVYTGSSTLEEHLSPRTYSELTAYLEANSIPASTFRHFKPSFLIMTLTLMELEKLGISHQGVDQFFYDLASKEKKGIEGLETVDEQLNYILSMADGNEDEFISYSLKEMATLSQQFASLTSAWRKGDTVKLEQLMIAEFKSGQPKIYGRLITDRNRNWLPIIDGYQKMPGTRFVLVGAAHLVGGDGIIAALEKKGYKIAKL